MRLRVHGADASAYFTLPARSSGAGVALARRRRRAPARASRERLAASDTRSPVRERASLRRHAARLRDDLSATPSGHRGRPLLRRAGGARMHSVPCRSTSGVAAGHRRLAQPFCRPAAWRSARHRAVGGRRCARFTVTCPTSRSRYGLTPNPSIAMPVLARVATLGMLTAEKGLRGRCRVRAGCARALAAAFVSDSGRGRCAIARVADVAPVAQRRVRGSRPGEPARRRTTSRPVVPGAGSGDLCLHAFAGDRERPADRRLGPRRIPRSPRWQARYAHRALERFAVGMERCAADVRAGLLQPSSSVPAASWPSDYRARYLAPVARSSRAPRGRELEARHFEAPQDTRQPELSLAELVTAGVACGKVEARSELARRAARADVDISELAHRATKA